MPVIEPHETRHGLRGHAVSHGAHGGDRGQEGTPSGVCYTTTPHAATSEDAAGLWDLSGGWRWGGVGGDEEEWVGSRYI